MANGKRKGGNYEREVCRDLSLWWTGGKRDDVFYRTNASGGRATSRAKRKKDTYGAYGDIAAQDPVGQPLLEVMVFEIKRGYPQGRISDLLDRGPKSKRPLYDEWIEQAQQSCEQAGSYGWAIIHRRDSQKAIITISGHVFEELRRVGVQNEFIPHSYIIVPGLGRLFTTTLEQFFKHVPPHYVKSLAATI